MDTGQNVRQPVFGEKKPCSYCGHLFVPLDTRKERLCPICAPYEREMRAVLGDRSFGSATLTDKKRIFERSQGDRTKRTGPTFGKQYYIDKGLPLPVEYQ